ncbi:hypothetical protein F66182_7678 [Fusarium sp. NRRL 66182]|nr:hypothetical protein F66182_7678 [Fusarium sp. NRRL 66182]
MSDQIRQQVFTWLNATPFAAASLESLTGGQANFTYRARLLRPLQDGTTDVVVKHGEPYMARHPANEITIDRCDVEAECLAEMAANEVHAGQSDSTIYTVRTTKAYTYDTETKNLVLEYLPNVVDLKTFSLNHFPCSTPRYLQQPTHNLGKALAEYMAKFHEMTREAVRGRAASPDVSPLTKFSTVLDGSDKMQALKHWINYDWLMDRVDQFPDILTEAKEIFMQVKQMALQELTSSDLTIIHGDYYPQNILQDDSPLQAGTERTLFVVDWENAQLGVPSMDHGGMMGEMYVLWLYKHMDAGLWMVQGYAEGLGPRSEAQAWRVALQMGVHLVSFGTLASGWGTPTEVENMARLGRDMIVKAWNKDRDWFEQSELACLFSGTVREKRI